MYIGINVNDSRSIICLIFPLQADIYLISLFSWYLREKFMFILCLSSCYFLVGCVCLLHWKKISFTLYPSHIRVGRETLVLKYSGSSLSAEFWNHCVLSGGTQRHSLPTPERRNGNINLNKIFYFLDCGSNLQPVALTATFYATAQCSSSLL